MPGSPKGIKTSHKIKKKKLREGENGKLDKRKEAGAERRLIVPASVCEPGGVWGEKGSGTEKTRKSSSRAYKEGDHLVERVDRKSGGKKTKRGGRMTTRTQREKIRRKVK